MCGCARKCSSFFVIKNRRYKELAEKTYYWLRLKRDFFKRHDIQIIESMPNGKDYILFYLKLLCESVDHEGNLRFSEQIPYSDQMLSVITNTNIDIVRSAVKIFTELEMMEILDDGTYFLSEVQKLIGSETEWAQKKRDWREKKKLLEDNSRTKKDNVRQEIEKEKDIELELEIEKEKEKDIELEKDNIKAVKKPPKHKHGEYQHVLLTDDELNKLFDEYGEEATEAGIKYVDEYIEMTGKKYKSHYLVLKKWGIDGAKKPKGKQTTDDYLQMWRDA